MDKHLEVIDLSKVFTMHILGGKKIYSFEHISFCLSRGTFLGITGKSGYGKSSLIRCIYRNYDSTSGDIYLYGENGKINLTQVGDSEMLEIRKTRIGYVNQFFSAIPRVTTMDIVIEPLMEKGWNREDAVDRAKELFLLFGIPENLWDAYPSTFSGGEKQRINLMRTFIDCPEIILLDEPTASLDTKNRDIVLNILEKMKEQKITMIGIFHNQEELLTMADEVLYVPKPRDYEHEQDVINSNRIFSSNFAFNLSRAPVNA